MFDPFDAIFVNLRDVEKMQISIMLLLLWYIILEKMSAFSLTLFVGTPFSFEPLEASKSFISLMTFS